MQDKPHPDQAAEAEHEREKPDDAGDRRFIGEDDLELGEVDLRLVARRRFEADLKGWQPGRTNVTQRVGDGSVAALLAAFAKLPQQLAAGQARIGSHPFAQIPNGWINPMLARLSWAVYRRLQATGDASANGLAVDPEFAGDR